MSTYLTPGWTVELTSGGHLIRMRSALEHRSHHEPQHVIDYDHGLTVLTPGQFLEADAIVHAIAATPEAALVVEAATALLTDLTLSERQENFLRNDRFIRFILREALEKYHARRFHGGQPCVQRPDGTCVPGGVTESV